jgi:hypothetical protein
MSLSPTVMMEARPSTSHSARAIQRCVIEAHARIGYRALERLLRQPWAGQQEFLLMLLAHHRTLYT